MTMPKTSQYTVGWIDTSIHDFLAEIDDPSSSMAYALVTCLDSSFQVASLADANRPLQALKNQGRVVGQGVLLTTRRLLALERHERLFFGFDEVWFFSHAEIGPKPKNVVITGPNRILSPLMASLKEWMDVNGCSLGLGDGAGMNFCARLRGVARRLVESFSESEFTASENGRAIASPGTARRDE
jgi:hypothetical protein